MQKIIALCTIVLFLSILSCVDDDAQPAIKTETDQCEPNLGYSFQISNIVDQYCNIPACHASVDQAAGIDLGNYNALSKATESGKFFKSLQREKGAIPMPPDGFEPIPAEKIKILECWVLTGKMP